MLVDAHVELLAELTDYGRARGWAVETLRRARRSVTAVLAEHPDLQRQQPLDAAAARQFLLDRHLVALRAVEFLIDHGLAVSQDTELDRWLTGRLDPLPATIRGEVNTWIAVLRGHGRRARRPRQTSTIQGYLRALHDPLTDWSARYESLRQVTTEDITASLTALNGSTRRLTLAALRSIFGTLKAERLIFTNPTARVHEPQAPITPVLGLEPGAHAQLLASTSEPGQRLIVLLAGVHALRTAQICRLRVDNADLGAGLLLVDGRPRRLDSLTREQLTAWLTLRRTRWPTSANPYLLINQSTAGGLAPIARSFVHTAVRRLGLTAHQLRTDRFLDEVHATAGDAIALMHLFGISDWTALRYCAELDPLDQTLEFAELTAAHGSTDLQ